MLVMRHLRDVSLEEVRGPHFQRFCELAAKAREARTTGRMAYLVPADEAGEFHTLLNHFKSKEIKFRRFARGPRNRKRATCGIVATCHSFGYYIK